MSEADAIVTWQRTWDAIMSLPADAPRIFREFGTVIHSVAIRILEIVIAATPEAQTIQHHRIPQHFETTRVATIDRVVSHERVRIHPAG